MNVIREPKSHGPLAQQIRLFGPANVAKLIETAVQSLVEDIYHPTLLAAYKAKNERIDEYSLSRDKPWALETAFSMLPGGC